MRGLLAGLGISLALVFLTSWSIRRNPPQPVARMPPQAPRPLPSFVPTTTTLPIEEQTYDAVAVPDDALEASAAAEQSFDAEPELSPEPAATTGEDEAPPVEAPRRVVRLGPGTEIKVRLESEIDSEHASVEDRFRAVLARPLKAGGMELAERGAPVEGIVTRVDQPGRASGKARIDLELRRIRVGGVWVSVTTETRKEKKGGGKGDALRVLGGAVVGAVGGAMADGRRGAKRGAAGGAAAGATVSLATRGPKVLLKEDKELSFDLSQPAFFPHPEEER